MFRKIIGVLLFITCFVLLASTQPQDIPGIKKAPVSRTSPTSGKEMFTHYCASCHGKDGKGDGPAAPALKKAPADLTGLASHNKGKFPEERVYGFIEGIDGLSAHGSREMPIWGEVFKSLSPADNATVQQRISNLTEYVKSLQQK